MWRRFLQRLVVGLLSAAAVIVAAFVAALFLVDEHELKAGGPREWLFVRGTLIDRLGLVEPDGNAEIRYSTRRQAASEPASTTLRYESSKSATDVIEAYAKACAAQSLDVGRRDDTAAGKPEAERYLSCDGAAGDVYVTAAGKGSGSKVTVRVQQPLR